MSHNPLPDWNQWQALSRQYFDAWQGMTRADAAGVGAGDKPSMTQGFEQWSRLFGGHGGVGAETIERIVDSVKSYAAFMQAMLGTISPGATPIGLTSAFTAPFAIPGFDAGAFGNPAFRAWSDSQGNMAPGFAQALAAMAALRPSAGAQADATAELKSWLSLPAFGLMREHQEHYQEAANAWLDYQQQMSCYNALMLKASQRGFESFQSKLASREEPGRQVDSLRGLYDLWVDAAEEGYAEVALSIEFREAYAALVNAQMRVRASVQKEVERISSDVGVPTRSEINSIGERLQALRREVRSGERKTSGGDVERKLARLRRDVDALTKHGSAVSVGAKSRDNDERTDMASVRIETVESADAAPATVTRERKSSKRRSKLTGDDAPRAKKRKKTARAKRASNDRASAAAAPGTFASRIARFADASLGAARPRMAKSKKSKKNR